MHAISLVQCSPLTGTTDVTRLSILLVSLYDNIQVYLTLIYFNICVYMQTTPEKAAGLLAFVGIRPTGFTRAQWI